MAHPSTMVYDKVFVFIDRQICLHHEAGRHTTAEHYDQALRSFKTYMKGRDLGFEDMTPQLIMSYETWLKSHHLCRNTTSFYMRNLRTLYNKAVEAGIASEINLFQKVYTGIEPDIQKLIDKYHNPDTRYLLPLIKKEDGTERSQYRKSAQSINRTLKKLANKLGITSPLSLYVARHSWASIAQSNHEPLSVISAAMGHDSELTTQIYLASIQTAQIDEANSKILRSLK